MADRAACAPHIFVWYECETAQGKRPVVQVRSKMVTDYDIGIKHDIGVVLIGCLVTVATAAPHPAKDLLSLHVSDWAQQEQLDSRVDI